MTEVSARQPLGAPCWVTLLVDSLPPAEDFYGNLFGWKFQPGPDHFGPYVRATLNGRLVAGIGESRPVGRGSAPAWTMYLCSRDADTTAELIRGCGGTVAVGPLDADEQAGRMAIAADPSGAVFGVWQPDRHAGLGVSGEPGTLAWNELVTSESEVAAKFYSAVFGLEPQPAPHAGPDRLTLRLDGRPVAGVVGVGQALPYGRAARWMTFFAVADLEEATDRARRLGGHVVSAPHESEHGRQSTVLDPQGAVFGLIGTAA